MRTRFQPLSTDALFEYSVRLGRMWFGFLLFMAGFYFASEVNALAQPFHESAQTDLSLTKQPPVDDEEHVGRLLKAISLPANIEIRITELQGVTARAVLLKQRRFIIYSRSFMDRVKNPIRDWAALGLFAHEVGHHLAGHTLLSGGSSRKTELEADEWAGFILGYLGATEAEATNAVDNYAMTVATATHPSREERRAAVIAGWGNAKKGVLATTTAIKCRELLDMMEIHWDWFSELAYQCSDAKKFLAWAGSARRDILARFIELGMQPNVIDEDGRTALHRVVSALRCEGKQESVRLLIDVGADPTLVDKNGESPIGMPPHTPCAEKGWQNSALAVQLARFMLQAARISGRVDLSFHNYFQTARTKTPQDFYYFELNGTDGKIQDDDGNTALHHATLGCNMALIQFMLKHRDSYGSNYMYPGAQRLRNRDKKNALDLARERRAQCPAAYDFLSRLFWD